MPPLISARWRAHAALLVFGGLATTLSVAQDSERAWLAGDSHIHSHWSPGYDRTVTPPVAIQGRDALYPTPLNARMAQSFGLSWMVTTDHGGANHRKHHLPHPRPGLEEARELVP